ncbi:MAG: hypothetical protein IPF93_15355 [Saprospiraceae bacterium]|nr:hypothetical protein [Saprospiraceae bacterium]
MNKSDLLAATLLLAGNAMVLDTNAQVKTTEIGDKTISVQAGGVQSNFVSNGTANFLGPKYLVYNGTPLTPNDKIKLTDKKYNLSYLSKATAQTKYGEKGKDGAVEIWLAE